MLIVALTSVIRFSFWLTCVHIRLDYVSLTKLLFLLLLTSINSCFHNEIHFTDVGVLLRGIYQVSFLVLIVRKLEFIPPLHLRLVMSLTLILNTVIFAIIFAQYEVVGWWRSVLNLLLILVILSICLLIQRMLVQKIAYDLY